LVTFSSVNIYQITWRHIPEDYNIHSHSPENLNPNMYIYLRKMIFIHFNLISTTNSLSKCIYHCGNKTIFVIPFCKACNSAMIILLHLRYTYIYHKRCGRGICPFPGTQAQSACKDRENMAALYLTKIKLNIFQFIIIYVVQVPYNVKCFKCQANDTSNECRAKLFTGTCKSYDKFVIFWILLEYIKLSVP
jgi:hypothetical protein